MAACIGRIDQAARARWRQWRRALNLSAGQRRASGSSLSRAETWAVAAGLMAALGGGAVIAAHARYLGQSAAAAGPGLAAGADALQPVAPGAAFDVPAAAGVTVTRHAGAAILVASAMEAQAPVRVDLCSQMLEGERARLLPLRIGYRFGDVAKLVERNALAGRPLTLRNVALAGQGDATMPKVQVSGLALADFNAPLTVAWEGARGVRWTGDAGPAQGSSVQLRRSGWLDWDDGALRLQRRASHACPRAGELLIQVLRKGERGAGRALVSAYPASGPALTTSMRPGAYVVPQLPRASLEDQFLFQQLTQHGLLRLSAGGLVEVAPRDLPAWQAAPAAARSADLAGWPALSGDAAAMALFKRMYRMADGVYVREQIRIYNSERRLLAWRVRSSHAQPGAQASVAGAPVALASSMPLAAARLFADVPQGWAPWQRVDSWPESGPRAAARINLALPQAAREGQQIEVLLVGQVLSVDGGRLLGAPRGACSGRACPSVNAAQRAVIVPLAGARSVSFTAAPLAMDALAADDQRYRHVRVAANKLAWQPLAANSSTARRAPEAGVTLHDRHGTLLWSAGAPTPAAAAAGLAPLLGLRAGHAASVAGMLARVPTPSGLPHSARLSLDLPVQAASQAALDCIGMRRGRWDGQACRGAQDVPAGRQAGIVVIDTESGDVLAAAGAGAGQVSQANWDEVRDFDRANPARSPLRLPALQHDGGAHRSPGSTFKIITALGLELAAASDPQVESLLAGMPLQDINRMAQARGFAFQTAAAHYPHGTRLAHITNYKDQHLDRRAEDGRLGLAQALTYSLNTWFAWSGELSDRSLFGRASGGAPDLQPLEKGALDSVRPIAAMAHRLGFEQELRLDGGLLPADFAWSGWDALQASRAHIDPIHTRHELRQMSIGLRMQVTPLHMALVAGAVGQGRVIAPRLLLELDGQRADEAPATGLGVRLDRIRAGMKGVVDSGTAAAAFRGPGMAGLRQGLSGKTGTAPSIVTGADGARRELATVWFTGWLEPGSVPGQRRRLAVAAFVSHSEATGGEHAAPIVAAVLGALASSGEKKGTKG